MTSPTTSDLLKLANLQIAAEAFIKDDKSNSFFGSGADLISALERGNDHSSKFTHSQATAFAAHWVAVAQQANTSTGFSGTLFKCILDDPATGAKAGEFVISLRSTEFIDDSARDNMATNTLEIKNTGFAWGQISDMQAWYEGLKTSGKLPANQAFTLTGYSLGGHLATAFNLLNPTAAAQTVTFNGAGVGLVTQGTLDAAIKDFNALEGTPSPGTTGPFGTELIASRLGDAGLGSHYTAIQGHLADKSWSATQAISYLDNAYASIELNLRPAMFTKLKTALQEIDTLANEATRVATLTSGDGSTPKNVPTSDMAALDLNYRMAMQLVAANTQAATLTAGLAQAYGNKAMLGVPAGNTALSNEYDVVANTSPSAVSNSQWHYGADVRVDIEDQPLYRGGITLAVVKESIAQGDVKLLVNGYATKDFGDTHSLVLMVDSLSVQNTVSQLLVPTARDTPATKAALNTIYQAATYLKSVNGDAALGPNQGKAEGDLLENIVNGLADLFLGSQDDVGLYKLKLDEGAFPNRRSLAIKPSSNRTGRRSNKKLNPFSRQCFRPIERKKTGRPRRWIVCKLSSVARHQYTRRKAHND